MPSGIKVIRVKTAGGEYEYIGVTSNKSYALKQNTITMPQGFVRFILVNTNSSKAWGPALDWTGGSSIDSFTLEYGPTINKESPTVEDY